MTDASGGLRAALDQMAQTSLTINSSRDRIAQALSTVDEHVQALGPERYQSSAADTFRADYTRSSDVLRDFQPSLSSVSRELDSAGHDIAQAAGVSWGTPITIGRDSRFHGFSGGGGGGGGSGVIGGNGVINDTQPPEALDLDPNGSPIQHDGTITYWDDHGTLIDNSRYHVGDDQGHFNVDVGQVEAKYGGSFQSKDGSLQADANFDVGVYAVHMHGGGSTGNVPLGPVDASAGVSYDAYIGANAKGDANLSIGPDKLEGEVKVDAFIGEKAQATAKVDVGGVGGSVTGSVSYGLGATFDVQGGYDNGHVKATVDLGLTFGLGAGVKFNVDLNVNEAALSITNIGRDIFKLFG